MQNVQKGAPITRLSPAAMVLMPPLPICSCPPPTHLRALELLQPVLILAAHAGIEVGIKHLQLGSLLIECLPQALRLCTQAADGGADLALCKYWGIDMSICGGRVGGGGGCTGC